jgi:LytS/YehU family sensor histidine kinase
VISAPETGTTFAAPAADPRRDEASALAAAVALVAPRGALVRFAYLYAIDSGPDAADLPNMLVTFWFRYAQQAALITIVAEFYLRESRSVQAMHRAQIDRLALDREMAEARLQVLQAQIEPHFLFNTLANVRRLYQTDLAAGRAMLDNLMRYLEVALPCMREDRSTVGRELTLIEAYLKVQGIIMGRRWPSRSTCERNCTLDLPPMMLLTLVEKAIKHGLNPLPEGGAIRIGNRRRISSLTRLIGGDPRVAMKAPISLVPGRSNGRAPAV